MEPRGEDPAPEAAWYEQGLRFECTRCGRCCGGAPGTVRVSSRELDEIAAHLGLTREVTEQRYATELPDGALGLRERSNHECVFYLAGEGCVVHPARPRQCRTWPFWARNVSSEQRWDETASFCPGAGTGPLHDARTIRECARNDGTSGTR